MPVPLTTASDPQKILALVEPALPGLCAALLDAVREAKEEAARRRILALYDWNHHASTVRTALLRDLQEHPIAEDFRLLPEPSSGIHARYGDFRFKVLKEPPFELPVGTATARQKIYCRQPEVQMAMQFSADGEVAEVRLFLRWAVDANYDLRSLRLACPVDAEGEDTEEAWSVPVLHLIDHLVGKGEGPAPADDEGELEDLDIEPRTGGVVDAESDADSTLDIEPKGDQPAPADAEDTGTLG